MISNNSPATGEVISLKIALIGYGKMGKAIEAAALNKGHTIALKIDVDTLQQFTKENLGHCDVAIEFTGPHSAADNILACLAAGIPVVSGSTGWLERWEEITGKCAAANGSLVYASNYSIGVNIFFEVNKLLARLMDRQTGYEVAIEEIHHTQKKDAPSGTAITLAEQITTVLERKKSWVNHVSGIPTEIPITSKRIDPAPGTHTIKYSSVVDTIEITHTAHNREGFAEGAVLAAEFIKGKTGVFGMNQVLGFDQA